MIGNCSPVVASASKISKEKDELADLDLGPPAITDRPDPGQDQVIDITPPLSSFHYQVSKVCSTPLFVFHR
jgi:betaine lipid synthase